MWVSPCVRTLIFPPTKARVPPPVCLGREDDAGIVHLSYSVPHCPVLLNCARLQSLGCYFNVCHNHSLPNATVHLVIIVKAEMNIQCLFLIILRSSDSLPKLSPFSSGSVKRKGGEEKKRPGVRRIRLESLLTYEG